MSVETALWCQTLHIHNSTHWRSNIQILEKKKSRFFGLKVVWQLPLKKINKWNNIFWENMLPATYETGKH